MEQTTQTLAPLSPHSDTPRNDHTDLILVICSTDRGDNPGLLPALQTPRPDALRLREEHLSCPKVPYSHCSDYQLN